MRYYKASLTIMVVLLSLFGSKEDWEKGVSMAGQTLSVPRKG